MGSDGAAGGPLGGHHADMAMDKHNMGEHKDEEEIEIGLLEVQPR